MPLISKTAPIGFEYDLIPAAKTFITKILGLLANEFKISL